MRFCLARLIFPCCLLMLLACGSLAQSQPAITISPSAGPAESAVFDVQISGLAPASDYVIEILFADQVVFSSQERSDADGRIAYPISSSPGDAAGIYTLRALSGDQVIASAQFELTASVEISVSPQSAPIGAAQRIQVTGLSAGTPYRLEISDPGGAIAYSGEHSSDAQGMIDIEIISEPEDATGRHSLALYDPGGAQVAVADFSLTSTTDAQIQAALQPASARAGQAVDIVLSQLSAFASVTAQITSADGVLIDTLLARASSEGELRMTFATASSLPAGQYAVDIFVEAQKLASATLDIQAAAAMPDASDAPAPASETSAAPSQASASVSPQSAPIGSSHLVTVSGLGPGEAVTIDVSFLGKSVYQTAKTADADGNIRVELFTDAADASGDYIVTALREAGNQPAVVLTATAAPTVELVAESLGPEQLIESRLADGAADFSFDGQAGAVLLISLAAADFDPALALLDADGQPLSMNDDSRGQNDAAIGPLALPYSGRYRLEVSAKPLMMPQAALDGDFVLSISEVSLNSLEFDAPQAFSLSSDRPARYYSLPVETGDSLTVSLDSGGQLDTLLQVIAPDGRQLAFDDDSGPSLDAELSNLVFHQAATYTLAVSSFEPEASGSGTLTVRRNPVQALEAGAATITLSDKAIRDLVVFEAAEDEYLILNLQKLKGDVEDLYVTATVDGMEVMAYSTMGVPEELPLAFVMPMSGRVVVTLEKFGYDDGITLAVSLERPQ